MNSTYKITEREIQQALARFRANGGFVQALPAQVAVRPHAVGASYAAYEDPAELRVGMRTTSDTSNRRKGGRVPLAVRGRNRS